MSRPSVPGDTSPCHVIAADVFGNVFLDLTEDMAARLQVLFTAIEVAKVVIAVLSDSYSDVKIGEALALFDSSEHLEIAIRNGNAREQLGIKVGDAVTLRKRDGA